MKPTQKVIHFHSLIYFPYVLKNLWTWQESYEYLNTSKSLQFRNAIRQAGGGVCWERGAFCDELRGLRLTAARPLLFADHQLLGGNVRVPLLDYLGWFRSYIIGGSRDSGKYYSRDGLALTYWCPGNVAVFSYMQFWNITFNMVTIPTEIH